ncbi:MAG: hypothetical protein A2W27_02870 [Deltaproteobacteria bacterium RBG_16_44_11]|nr:MAG: hypothetical protein A2W27_02870 [Deltaproteobacteria bacterium RBG_16_44_11]
MMNKNIMILFISLFSFFFLFSCCKNSDADSRLLYLKNNFNKLYQNDYKQFWQILAEAEKNAVNCQSTSDTVAFLKLIEIDSTGVEFIEYFSEVIEKLCIENPKCFLDALSNLDSSAITRIVKRLKTPLFLDSKDIDAVFNKNKSVKKYDAVMKEYFRK